MLKKIIIIILLLALSFIAGVLYVKNTIDTAINNTINIVNDSIVGDYYNIKIIQVKSDFWQTKVVTSLQQKNSANQPIITTHSAKHFPIAIDSSRGIAINLAKIDSGIFTSWIQYNGKVTIVSEEYGSLSFAENFTKLRSKLDVNSLKLQSALEVQRGSNNLWYGTLLTFLDKDSQQLKFKLVAEDYDPNIKLTINSSAMKLPLHSDFNGPFNVDLLIDKVKAKDFIRSNINPAGLLKILQGTIKVDLKNTFFTSNAGKVILSLNATVGNSSLNSLNEFDILRSLQGEIFIKAPRQIIVTALQNRVRRELMQELQAYSIQHGGSENPVSYNKSIAAKNKEILHRAELKLKKLIADRILLASEEMLQFEAEFDNGAVLINGVVQEQL